MRDVRAAYIGSSVQTASPARLVVMLCERLVVDIRKAQDAQLAADYEGASAALLHAQAIVAELRGTLRVDSWKGAEKLGALYDYMLVQLVNANVKRDVEITRECGGLAFEISDMWTQAAALSAAEQPMSSSA